ncbi:uncharacterized protein LOC129598161 [Paramacrobiotus metropolitanus]|uniref:uncharacterized protein LOC129598161 n=1 Tax=Paramacrobiotus metropolitanus TaxID=2943436 RepID=UPI00244657CE|nr:uncharacterized protein LOC129598161 [Paramacrobiotus metropolitanus]
MNNTPPPMLICRLLILANQTDPRMQCAPDAIPNDSSQIPHFASQAHESWLHIGEAVNLTADRIKEEQAAAAFAAAHTTTPAPCDSEPGTANEYIILCPAARRRLQTYQ